MKLDSRIRLPLCRLCFATDFHLSVFQDECQPRLPPHVVNPMQPLEPSSPHSHLKSVDCSAHGSRAVGQHDSVIMAVVVDAKVLYRQLVDEHDSKRTELLALLSSDSMGSEYNIVAAAAAAKLIVSSVVVTGTDFDTASSWYPTSRQSNIWQINHQNKVMKKRRFLCCSTTKRGTSRRASSAS